MSTVRLAAEAVEGIVALAKGEQMVNPLLAEAAEQLSSRPAALAAIKTDVLRGYGIPGDFDVLNSRRDELKGMLASQAASGKALHPGDQRWPELESESEWTPTQKFAKHRGDMFRVDAELEARREAASWFPGADQAGVRDIQARVTGDLSVSNRERNALRAYITFPEHPELQNALGGELNRYSYKDFGLGDRFPTLPPEKLTGLVEALGKFKPSPSPYTLLSREMDPQFVRWLSESAKKTA